MSHVACIAGQSGPKGKERERTGETGPTLFFFSNINVSGFTSELGSCCAY